jgi:hypothetical protein
MRRAREAIQEQRELLAERAAAEDLLLCGPVAVTAGGGAEDTFRCVLDEGHEGEHLFAEEWNR